MAYEVGNPENSLTKNAEPLWQILQEMEENYEHKLQFSGSLGYPGFIQAVYRGRVQIGFEDENNI